MTAVANEDPFAKPLATARESFEQSTDFTLGVEEEYAICDPDSLDLVPAYERARDAAVAAGLGDAEAGELLASEIEFRTGKCESFADAAAELSALRARVTQVMRRERLAVGISGTHPWADYREQETIDRPYYIELVDRLQYVARRNNTFGMHVHVGVRGADRAIAVANALRTYQPLLLALSASSPFLDGRDSGLSSARSLTFSRTFPRGNVMPAFADFQAYMDYVTWLRDSGSITLPGQMWWGVRPHLLIGTVELRMFDGQPDVDDTLALVALSLGTIAYLCALHDAGELHARVPVPAAHLVDENLWRAARMGTDAHVVELPTSNTRPVAEVVEELIGHARAAGAAADLGIDAGLDRALEIARDGCSAARQRRVAGADSDLVGAYRWVVDRTMAPAVAGLGRVPGHA
jgi:carboxylate-amine ligase